MLKIGIPNHFSFTGVGAYSTRNPDSIGLAIEISFHLPVKFRLVPIRLHLVRSDLNVIL